MSKLLVSIAALGLIASPASAGYYPELAAMSVARSACEAWSAGASFREGVAYGFRAKRSLYEEEFRDPMFIKIVSSKLFDICPGLARQKMDEAERVEQK